MKQISSKWTFYHKRIFPVFWFGFLGLFILIGFFSGDPAQKPMFLLIPVVMALVGFFLVKKLTWDLVDEVFDCGDTLLIKNRGQETLVPLSNIMNVSVSSYVNPPRITLKLISPVSLGDEIAFSPVTGLRLNPFSKNQVAEDLIVRVHRAKSGRAV